MKFNLPVGMRDKLLKDQDVQEIALPNSQVGLQYYYQNQAQMVAAGASNENQQISESFSQDMQNLPIIRQLQQFSNTMQHGHNSAPHAANTPSTTTTLPTATPGTTNQHTKTAFRNLPKLCSFWLNGTCTRVLRKTCPFRPCCGPSAYAFPEIAGTHRDLCQELIKDLTTLGPGVVQKQMKADVKAALSAAIRGVNRDEAIRKRVSGEDDLTYKYLNKMKSMVRVL